MAPSKIVAWEKQAIERGVAIVAGERLAFDGWPIPFARFGFAPLDEEEVRVRLPDWHGRSRQ